MRVNESSKDILNREDGQAIFEFMIFLPIMLYMLLMLMNIGNSVNASINQQKAARGYTFYLLKGNSLGNRRIDLAGLESGGGSLQEVSSFIIGWRAEQDSAGQKSYASSYKLPTLPWGDNQEEDCLDKTDSSESKTQCIKVFTIFGICGETYVSDGAKLFRSDSPEFGSFKSCNFK